ncbi:MAG: SpoIIE family protein phosphatase [Kiritimatiellae bacterium]|nr:SpoIIE family protein phosphatase [Kiritimatiellia bacterium]
MADKLKVLVLDDERLVRFTISAYLKGADFSVTTAETPSEAIACVRRERFHAIVSDVMMGDMDGFMFRSLVREIDETIPVVFLTSMMNDVGNAFMERVTEDVHSYYVAKSAPRSVLVGKLRQVVKAYIAELNVRSMERHLAKDLALASFVQKAMLPQWVHVDRRYSYTSCFTPYREVSGDLYEWFPVSEDTALFIGGDIAGHGTTASLAMTAVQAFLKQFSSLDEKRARRVDRIAQSIHSFLHSNLRDVAYMVATIVYFDFKNREGLYLNCGNPGIMVVSRATGEQREINPGNLGALPLGLFGEAQYREEDVAPFRIEDDDVFVSMSDGIYDVSSDRDGLDAVPRDIVGEIISLAVRQTEAEGRTGLFAAIPHRIMSALADMGYVHRQDDVSFFVVGANPADESCFLLEVKMRPELIDESCRKAAVWVASRYGEEAGVKADLLLNEHLMNIYRHGLDDFGRQHEVSVLALDLAPDGFDVTVWDRGATWKDVASETESEADARLEAQNANLAAGGRGRCIVRKIADSISVERFMNLNKTVFRVKCASNGAGKEVRK